MDITLDDAERRSGFDQPSHQPEAPPPFKITARPFVWRDPKTIPRRRWLYGWHLIRQFASCTVALGGVGKTSLILVEAISMAIGRSLLGARLHEGPLKVLIFNLEDPHEEIKRRIAAICLHYEITPEELEGQLFINSADDQELIVARQHARDGVVIAVPVVEALIAEILSVGIDVTIVDPFVSCHMVNENDNNAIDAVVRRSP